MYWAFLFSKGSLNIVEPTLPYSARGAAFEDVSIPGIGEGWFAWGLQSSYVMSVLSWTRDLQLKCDQILQNE